MKTSFTSALDTAAADTESLLERLFSVQTADGEIERPKRLLDAMRYSALGGGKRLRPFLVVESAALFGAPRERALMAGAALECIHCYSLVHDDLPAMDNDELRRGRHEIDDAFTDDDLATKRYAAQATASKRGPELLLRRSWR